MMLEGRGSSFLPWDENRIVNLIDGGGGSVWINRRIIAIIPALSGVRFSTLSRQSVNLACTCFSWPKELVRWDISCIE